MLHLLQYASMICAFFLPFAIGWIVQSARNGDRRKLAIAVTALTAAVIIIAAAIWLAFALNGAAVG